MPHHCQDGYRRQRNSNVATEVGLEGRKATHGGDQRGESTARVWAKLLADLCGYPGQSGQRRLCACQNRETLLDDGVYWTPGTKQRNLLSDGILWFVRPQNEKEIDVLSKVNDAEIAHYTAWRHYSSGTYTWFRAHSGGDEPWRGESVCTMCQAQIDQCYEQYLLCLEPSRQRCATTQMDHLHDAFCIVLYACDFSVH